VFVIVHRHKNLALHFARMVSELIIDNVTSVDLRELYSTLEESYQEVVARLSGDGIYHRKEHDA